MSGMNYLDGRIVTNSVTPTFTGGGEEPVKPPKGATVVTTTIGMDGPIDKIEGMRDYYGGLIEAPKTIHMLKHFTNEDIRDVMPGTRICFKYCEGLTLCFLWIGNALRVGTANKSDKDGYKKIVGEKVALRRAIDQHKQDYFDRSCLWACYLGWRSR